MFWGLVLEPGKRYSTVVHKSFHVSMAALDCSSVRANNEILKVLVHTEDQENLLCNLSKDKGILQEKLDLNFMIGDNIAFECKGSGNVHLSGYLVPDDFEMEAECDIDEEKEEESEESEIDSPTSTSGQSKNKGTKAAKRKLGVPLLQRNKKKKDDLELDSDFSMDSADFDELGSDFDEAIKAEFEEEEEEEEEEDDEDEEDEEEEESDAKEETVMPQQLTKQQKKQQQKQTASPQNKQQTPGKQNKPAINGATPNQQRSAKKDKKKGQTPQAQTPGQNTATQKPKTPNSNEEGSPKKRVVEGGVVIKDLKIGNGQPAKSGKLVTVQYVGRLKNNKVFDKGDGFIFRLGKGEVIKGWDIGVNGMKVGGKRVLTCPPNVAYGNKGSLPTIPPNSTLIFEVELKAVN